MFYIHSLMHEHMDELLSKLGMLWGHSVIMNNTSKITLPLTSSFPIFEHLFLVIKGLILSPKD